MGRYYCVPGQMLSRYKFSPNWPVGSVYQRGMHGNVLISTVCDSSKQEIIQCLPAVERLYELWRLFYLFSVYSKSFQMSISLIIRKYKDLYFEKLHIILGDKKVLPG